MKQEKESDLDTNMTEVAIPLQQQNLLQVNNANVTKKNDKCRLYIHTGNIANWSNLKSRKANDIPANELYQSLSRALDKWSTNGNVGQLNNSNEVHINCTSTEKLEQTERGLLKITAKIFLQNFKIESIKEALESVMRELGLSYVDTLYLSLPPIDENSDFAEVIQPFWEEMERLKDAGFTLQISSCDLDQFKLQTLVEMVRTKPEVNQVNLASCCHMPEDLVSYAKANGIVLHTHGDQPIMLTDDNLNQLIKTTAPNTQYFYQADWLVRYAIVVKCRGVIKSKGYVTSIDGKSIDN